MGASYGRKPDGKESALVVRARDAFMTSVIAGTPRMIERQIGETLEAAELDGMMLVFPDYVEDLRIFGTEILPGLRERSPVAA